MEKIKGIVFRLSLLVYRLLFRMFHVLPIKHQVGYITYRHLSRYDNAYFTKEYVQNHSDYKFVLHNKNYVEGVIGRIQFTIFVVRGIYLMATSEVVIIDDYFLPMYVVKKHRNKFVMIWHASGAYKKFGNSIKGNKYGLREKYKENVKIHGNYDVVVPSGEAIIPHYQEAFNIDSIKIKGIGLPRVDYFFRNDLVEDSITKLYDQYPDLRNKKIILLAPTFRGKGQRSASYEISKYLLKQINKLPDEYQVVYHKHPFVKGTINNKKIMEITGVNIHELMQISDALITDYSSVIFEYSLLDKPIYLYVDDLSSYDDQRGFYIDVTTYENLTYDNAKNLLKNLQDNVYCKTFLQDIKQQAFTYLDHNNTKRVFEQITRR